MHVTILGKRYRLEFTRLRGKDGDCDDPRTKGKTLRIHKGLSEKDTLETVIHEALHAADWHKDEPWVDHVSRDIARILWRLGWRRPSVEGD